MRFDVWSVMWTFAVAVFVFLISMIGFGSEYVHTLIFTVVVFLNGILFGLVLIKH